MRAPFQILAIPYYKCIDKIFYCIFRRRNCEIWQFIAGGGEDRETPIQTVEREFFEESGVKANNIIQLKSMCYVPTFNFAAKHLWGDDLYVIPEYSFGVKCDDAVKLSVEHDDYVWVEYNKAIEMLKYDSNKTALYELDCILKNEN